ncbi:hypothetical protein OAD67_02070 [bacterium]|nr:hypothetical protein [bacterium]
MTPMRRLVRRLGGDAVQCVATRVGVRSTGRVAAIVVAQRFGCIGQDFGCPPFPRMDGTNTRGFSAAGLDPDTLKKRMDEINDAFTEARDEIESAMEAVGTTYFNEDAEIAKECVDGTLAMYYKLCEELDEETRGKTQRAMGMKMEQLKAEWGQVEHAHDEH